METLERARAILLQAILIGVETGQLDYSAKEINAAIKLAKAAPDMAQVMTKCLWLIEHHRAALAAEEAQC